MTTGKILNLEPCCNILEEEIDVVSLGEVLRMNPSGAASQVKSPSTPVAATTAGPVSHAPIRLKLKGKKKKHNLKSSSHSGRVGLLPVLPNTDGLD